MYPQILSASKRRRRLSSPKTIFWAASPKSITVHFTDLDKLVAEHMVKSTDPSQGKAMWSCIDCGKTSRLKNDMSKHVEAQHINHPGLMCEFCEKVLKTSGLKSNINGKVLIIVAMNNF